MQVYGGGCKKAAVCFIVVFKLYSAVDPDHMPLKLGALILYRLLILFQGSLSTTASGIFLTYGRLE